MVRSAARAELGAFVGAQQPLQHFSTSALRRLGRTDVGDGEALLRVHIPKSGSKSQAAARQNTDAAPRPITDFVNLGNDPLSFLISAAAHGANVLVLDFVPS